MTREQLEKRFIDLAFESPQTYAKDLTEIHDKVAHSKAIYKGKPIPFLYMPRFFDSADMDTFNEAVSHMMSICHKMIKLYKSVSEIRQYYNFDERLEALILKESPYASLVPMARFDIFYYGPGEFKFCELNTDGTSAMNEDKELARVFSSGALVDKISEEVALNSFELFDTWVEEVMSIYKESGGIKEKPSIAIVDLFEKSSAIEFEVFKERFEAHGLPCYIVDARQLTYNEGLFYEDKGVDIVYRRLVTRDMMDRIQELPALEAACHDNTTLIIGNIQSQVVHNKLFFKLLHDDLVRQYFNAEELAFIDAHVPLTESIEVAGHNIQRYIDEKDQWLIKPLDFYASIGVYAGRDHDPQAWRQLLEDHLQKPYLLQAFCTPPEFLNIDLVEGALKLDSYKHITGLFVYNGKLFGIYSRAGRTAIISGLHDVFTLPSLFIGNS